MTVGLAAVTRCLCCGTPETKFKKDALDGYCRLYCKTRHLEQIKTATQKKSTRKMCHGVVVEDFIEALRDLCESEDARNYPIGKRSAFYEIYNRGIVQGFTKDIFGKFYEPINEACEDGRLDDAYFVDASRRLSYSRGDSSVSEALLGRLSVTELDHWSTQPSVPMILCEKDGHQGILERVTSPKQVRLFTSKGTWSRPSLIKVAYAVALHINRGQKVVIGYVGDHDPAGMYGIEETAKQGNDKNGKVGLTQHLAKMGISPSQWSWERIAITDEQFKNQQYRCELELYSGTEEKINGKSKITLERRLETAEECEGTRLFTRSSDGKPAKADGNTSKYVAQYGLMKADAEALGFEGMREEVRKFIERHTDAYEWERSMEKSEEEVLHWKQIVEWFEKKEQENNAQDEEQEEERESNES